MRRVLLLIEKLFTYTAMLSIFVMMVLLTSDAVLRYGIKGGGFVGTYEMVEMYLMPFGIFLGICYTYRKGGFIRITFVQDRVPNVVKTVLNWFNHIFSTLVCIVLLITTGLKLLRIYETGLMLEQWPIPLWPAYLVAFLGFALVSVLLVVDLKRIKEKKTGLFGEESLNA